MQTRVKKQADLTIKEFVKFMKVLETLSKDEQEKAEEYIEERIADEEKVYLDSKYLTE